MERSTVLANEVLAPIAGQITAITVSSSADSLDLSLSGPQPSSAQMQTSMPGQVLSGLVNRWADFHAEGADVYVLFGASQAAVTGANAPVIATRGANTAGVCQRIPTDKTEPLFIEPSTKWIGFIASGAGTLRISPSSRGR